MPECLAHVALAGATALGWLGLGALALAPLRSSGDRLLDALNRIGAGALAFAMLTFAAGWLGLLYAAAYVPLLVAATLGGVWWLARNVPSNRLLLSRLRAWPRWQLALAVLLAAYVVLAVLATCAPVSSADALLHHAAAPELFADAHRIQETPWIWNSYQPYTVEMLILDGFLVWDSVQGAFAPLLLAVAAAASVGGATRRLAGRGAALLAGSVLFAQPFMLWISTSTFVEPGLAFMVALASWNVIHFAQHGTTRSLALAGLFAGGACGMKYLGVVAVLLFGASAAVLLRRGLRAKHVLAFGVPALAVALPWYAKNAVLAGNPLYPFFFGPDSEARRAAIGSFEDYGHGDSPLDLVLLPIRLLSDAHEFDRGEFVAPLMLLFAPVAFLVARARPAATAVWGAGSAYVLAWFYGSQHSRFLVPLLPAFSVLAAIGMKGLAARGRIGRSVTIAVAVAALATGVVVSGAYAAQFVRVVSGAQSERSFLLENVSYHAATEWANSHLPPDSRIAAPLFVLHFHAVAVPWTPDVLPGEAGPTETRAFFARFALTHALVLSSDVSRRRQVGYAGGRLIARVPVRAVTSRTLNELGPYETMLVFVVPPERG